MNIAHRCWEYPALLERREGIQQPTRRGSQQDIVAELRKLLGIADTPTKEACTPTGCAVPVASEETGMDSPITTWAQQGSAGQRKAPMADASTTTKPAGQGQPAGALQVAAGAAGTVTRLASESTPTRASGDSLGDVATPDASGRRGYNGPATRPSRCNSDLLPSDRGEHREGAGAGNPEANGSRPSHSRYTQEVVW